MVVAITPTIVKSLTVVASTTINCQCMLLLQYTVTVTITFSATFSGGVYTVGMECQGGGNVCNDNCLDVSFTL